MARLLWNVRVLAQTICRFCDDGLQTRLVLM